jgi:hypothetical protein
MPAAKLLAGTDRFFSQSHPSSSINLPGIPVEVAHKFVLLWPIKFQLPTLQSGCVAHKN